MTTRSIIFATPALIALLVPACSGGSGDNSQSAAGTSSTIAGTTSTIAGTTSTGGGGSPTVAGGTTSVGGTATGGSDTAGSSTMIGGTSSVGGTTSTGGGGAGGSMAAGGSGGSMAAGGTGNTAGPDMKVVMYLPNWNGTFAKWAGQIDFTKMTHLDLAFGTIKNGTNDWSLGAADSDVQAIAAAGHAKGVKVMVSIGGADDDIGIINRYTTEANIDPMVTNLDAMLTRLNLDGVDVDLERGNALKANGNFPKFLAALIAKLRPQGRVVSSALAEYIIEDTGDDAATTGAWLKTYDFINLMIYDTNMSTYTKELNWWTTQRNIPAKMLTWGVDFSNKTSADYAKQLTVASKADGGVMAWELSQPNGLTLWKAVQDAL